MRRAVLVLAALPVPALADDTQGWAIIQLKAPLAPRASAGIELTARAGDDVSRLVQLQSFVTASYRLNERLELSGGYGRVLNRAAGGRETGEDRFRQQLSAKLGAALGGALSARLRLEERMVDHAADTQFRLRTQLKQEWRIARPTALVLSHESFFVLNRTDWSATTGWTAMRNYAGLRQRLVKGVELEGGYLDQYTRRPGRPDTRDRVLQTTLTFTIG